MVGRAEAISNVSRRALAAYHHRAYSGERIVLAAAGNLRHDELVGLLEERRHGAVARVGMPARKPVRRSPLQCLCFQRKDTEQYHVCLSAPGIARDDERRFAASLLDAAIVGGSASSRLFQEIRQEARDGVFGVQLLLAVRGHGRGRALAVGTRAENLAACLEIAVAELADVSRGNVRPDELARAKENLKGRLLLSLESTSNRMTRLGKALVTDTPLLSVG